MGLSYFMISRTIFESPIWRDDPDILKLFLYLIGNARYSNEPKRYPNFEVKRGEVLTSLQELSDSNEYLFRGCIKKWSRAKVSRMLQTLQTQKYITIVADTYGTHLTICNYDTYQDPQTYQADTRETGLQRVCNASEHNSNKDNKDKKGNKEISNHPINLFISENCKVVGRLKTQMTDSDCIKLSDRFGEQAVKDILLAMENWKKIANYNSVYLTAKNWLEKREKDGTNIKGDKQGYSRGFKFDPSKYPTISSKEIRP